MPFPLWTWTDAAAAVADPVTTPLGAFARAEYWSRPLGDGGALLGHLTPVVGCSVSYTLDGRVATSKVMLTVPRSVRDALGVTMQPRGIIRLYDIAGNFEEFRLAQIQDGSGRDGLARLEGLGIINDLGDMGEILTDTVANQAVFQVRRVGTVSTLLTEILTFGPAHITLGSVVPTATVEVVYDVASPLAAAIQVVDAAALAEGVEYELSLRQDVLDYKLDCGVTNSTADAATVRTAKNLESLVRRELGRDMVNRVYPLGSDGRGIGDNWWVVTTVSTNTYIEVEDIGGGLAPLLFDDELDGFYVVDDANTTHEITASTTISDAVSRLAMASTTNISVGDWVRIARNSSGDAVAYLDKTSSLAVRGVQLGIIRPDVPGATNWAKNATLSTWTGTYPGDWATDGSSAPTKTTTTGLWLSGGASSKHDASGRGMQQTRSVYVPTGWSVVYVFRVYLEAYDLTTNNFVLGLNPNTGTWGSPVAPPETSAGAWTTLTTSYVVTSGGVKTLGVRCTTGSGSGSGVLYLDSAAIYLLRHGDAIPEDFIAGSGGAQLWQRGLQHLRLYADPQSTYEVDLADLTRLDGERWPYDALRLGGTVDIQDTDLDLTVSARVVAMTRDELNPVDTRVTLSTRKADLARYLARKLR